MTGTNSTTASLPLTIAGAKRCKTKAQALSMRDKAASEYVRGVYALTLKCISAAYAADVQGLLGSDGEHTLTSFGKPFNVGKSQVSNWRNTGRAWAKWQDLTEADFKRLCIASAPMSTKAAITKVIADKEATLGDLRAAMDAVDADKAAEGQGSDKAKAGRKAKESVNVSKATADLAKTLDSDATATAKASELIKTLKGLLPRLDDSDLATLAKTVADMAKAESARRVNAAKAKAAKADKAKADKAKANGMTATTLPVAV
jgi:hypothetical protein